MLSSRGIPSRTTSKARTPALSVCPRGVKPGPCGQPEAVVNSPSMSCLSVSRKERNPATFGALPVAKDALPRINNSSSRGGYQSTLLKPFSVCCRGFLETITGTCHLPDAVGKGELAGADCVAVAVVQRLTDWISRTTTSCVAPNSPGGSSPPGSVVLFQVTRHVMVAPSSYEASPEERR